MTIHFSMRQTSDGVLKIQETNVTDGFYYIAIGGDYSNQITFFLTPQEMVEMMQQWQYEINAALYEEYSRNREAEAHAADGTLADLVNGANAGGRQ
jgi:hypothetical protein